MIIFNQKKAKTEIRRLRKIVNGSLDAGLKKMVKPSVDRLKGISRNEADILGNAAGVRNLKQREKFRYGLKKQDRAVKIGFVRNTQAVKLKKAEKDISLPGLASILSYGAKAHEITSKNKVLKFGDNYATKIQHPGVKGSGFLRVFFDQTERFSESLFYQGINEHLKKHGY